MGYGVQGGCTGNEDQKGQGQPLRKGHVLHTGEQRDRHQSGGGRRGLRKASLALAPRAPLGIPMQTAVVRADGGGWAEVG